MWVMKFAELLKIRWVQNFVSYKSAVVYYNWLRERLVDLDEGVQEWRYRHVKMVERTIGTKPGTGGSSGAEYLRNTVGRNLFPDLWEIRANL